MRAPDRLHLCLQGYQVSEPFPGLSRQRQGRGSGHRTGPRAQLGLCTDDRRHPFLPQPRALRGAASGSCRPFAASPCCYRDRDCGGGTKNRTDSQDKPYNERSDVWALGVVLYECCTGRHPFEAQNEGALIRKIMKGVYPPVQGPYSQQLRDVLALCLTMDPTRRPDTSGLLAHPTIRAKAKALGIDLSVKGRSRSAEEVEAELQPRQAPAVVLEAATPQQAPAGFIPPAPQQPQQGEAAAAFGGRGDPFLQPGQRAPAAAAAAGAGPGSPARRPGNPFLDPSAERRGAAYQQPAPMPPPPAAAPRPFTPQQQQVPQVRAKADNLHDVFRGMGQMGLQETGPRGPRPEDLPPAGVRVERPGSARAPWAQAEDAGPTRLSRNTLDQLGTALSAK